MRKFVSANSDIIVVDNAHIFAVGSAFSVAAWVKGAAQTNKTIYGEGRSSSNNGYFDLSSGQSTSSKLRLVINNNSGTNLLGIESTATAFDSAFHHVAFTCDASRNYVLYVDGVSDKTGTYTSGTTSPNQAAIGALRRSANSLFLDGSILDLATWTRQLSAKEILSLVSGLPASFFGPAHYWPLWGKDSPEPDIGLSSHTAGVLTGTAFDPGGKVAQDLLLLG